MTQELTTVYLAGPDVFFQDDSGEIKKQLCHNAGFTPLFPLDNEIKGADPAPEIYQANIAMIDQCHIVMANITPFRGPSCDLGTAFEIGYALKAGKKVFCYSSDTRELKQRISEDFPHFLEDGMSIEDFGHIDNLMISCSTPIDCVDDRNDNAALKAFQCALERAQSEQQSAVS